MGKYYNLRKRISNKLVVTSLITGLVSVVFLGVGAFSKHSATEKLSLLQNLKEKNPTLIVDTRKYEEKYKVARTITNIGLGGVGLMGASCTGAILTKPKYKREEEF